MSRTIVCGALAAALAVVTAGSSANEIGTEIDLATFGEAATDVPSVWNGVPVQEVDRRFGTAPRRLYVSAMIGPSFANVWSPVQGDLGSQDTILAAGGALGVAVERANGRTRIEVEGMGRDTYAGEFYSYPGDSTFLTSNWSAMGNIWRDIMITERLGIYAGAGIGGGGYVLSDHAADGTVEGYGSGRALAWQGGGGLLWEITDRLTFDVGYRYFRIDTIDRVDAVPDAFGASELMFALRLYEPFRGWER